jgi:tetratricopeptide (TPR) repeat protein
MLGSRYRGRRKGVAVRAGSVEQARREARLTLAQVAGGKLTRTAIHLIEKGRTRPSMETLQQIARQTHKPIEFFLNPDAPAAALTERQAQLRELERLTGVRELQAVVELGQKLLDQRWSADDAAIIHFSVGQAHCRMVRPQEALEHLRFARAEFDRLGDEWMAVEALDWESSALGLLDDPAALPLANKTLERCRRLGPGAAQIEARILGHIAGMYVVTQSWALAVRYYEEAVEVASSVKDLLQLAKMHHGLGVAYERMHDGAVARQHFDKALALYSVENDQASIWRVENDLGLLMLTQGHLDSAERHLLAALSRSTELNIDRRGRGFTLVNLGDVMLQRGRLAEATDYLAKALEVGEATGERIVQAEASVLLGHVEERNGNAAMADEQFEIAIQILEELRMPDRLRDANMEYAEILDARQDVVAASRHWKRAAEISKLSSLGMRWTATPPAERIASAGPTGAA